MAIRLAINGFGRTGRALLRASQRHELDLEVVAINDVGSPDALARLLARDSVYGRLDRTVAIDGNVLVVGGHRILLPAEHEVKALPWAKLGVDIVVEATGRFTAREDAAGHLDAGARRVVVSAPSKGADATFVMGVNDDAFDPARHIVVSNASCTTNCLAVLAKVLDDTFGIEEGFMTTVHAYTGDQQLVDGLHKDPRRARAAAINIVPTTTGAARATGIVLPAVQGRLDGLALRVPVPDGSITDLVAHVTSKVTVAHVQDAYREAAGAGPLQQVLEYADEPLVSSDIVGSAASCVFDAPLTMVQGRLVKVLGWYDNEWGYANRLAELAAKVGAAPRSDGAR
jgi:glyceraldehyde 3-phosphate dehydrogenase